jgi:hypothetical protein
VPDFAIGQPLGGINKRARRIRGGESGHVQQGGV